MKEGNGRRTRVPRHWIVVAVIALSMTLGLSVVAFGDWGRSSATSVIPVSSPTARLALVRGGGTRCVTGGSEQIETPLVPPPGSRKLPARSRHGWIQYLRQYPAVALATSVERRRARLLLAELVAAADEGNWRDVRAAARAGYRTRTFPRKPGDRSIHYFHAERHEEPRTCGILNTRRPKALIYANAPGRPLVLVGAMWSTRTDEIGPTPGGPITRWHFHVHCSDSRHEAARPPAEGSCPSGQHLHRGRNEMLHVWFTEDLRSAFALRAPEPELCAAGLLPTGYCGAVMRR